MNGLRSAWVVGALCLAVSTAQAGTIPDPKILVMGSGYSEVLHDLDFTFAANPSGGGSLDFFNASGVDWAELSIATAMPYGIIGNVWVALNSPQYYNVASDLFTDSALSFGTSSLTIRLFGLDSQHPGIRFTGGNPGGNPGGKADNEAPYGSHFFINLDNTDTPDVGGWLGEGGEPLAFRATATPAPEPGTFVLVLGGLLALGLRFRRRR